MADVRGSYARFLTDRNRATYLASFSPRFRNRASYRQDPDFYRSIPYCSRKHGMRSMCTRHDDEPSTPPCPKAQSAIFPRLLWMCWLVARLDTSESRKR